MNNINNEVFKLLIENVYDIIFLYRLTPEPKFEYVSPSSINVCGYSPEEFYKNPDLFYKLVPLDDLPLFQFIKENPHMVTKPIILRWRRKDGKIIWTEQRFVNIYDNEGNLISIEGIVRDITERKETEFALRESEKKFRELFHQINDSIFLFRIFKDKFMVKLIEVNNTACQMLSYNRNEFFHMNRLDKVILEDQIKNLKDITKTLIEKKQIFFESILIDKNNNKIPVDVNAHFFRLNGENVVMAIVRDITERKKFEKELLKKQRLESISILAAGIAHEFNNILSAILGNISLAKLHLDNVEELKELLHDSEDAGIKAKQLINRLITFSEGGQPIKESVSFEELIKKSINNIMNEKKVDVKMHISKQLYKVNIDKEQIAQALNNILTNSIESLFKRGKIEIFLENVIDNEKERLPLQQLNYIRLIIKDNGKGISKKNLNKIFDPFFTTKSGASGLGLAVVYSIIKKHEGYITIESKENKGTSIYIYLPAENIKTSNKTKKNSAKQKLNVKGTILLMDDDEDVRFTVGKLIQKLGYQVEYAKEGLEAIEIYKKSLKSKEKIQLIIMDLTIVGGMGGKDAIEAILKIDSNANAIVSSGYYNDPIIANYREYGFKGFLSKPFTFEELDSTINKVLKNN